MSRMFPMKRHARPRDEDDHSPMLLSLLSLPELVLPEISSFLDVPDLCRTDASCKSFQRANIRVWQQRDDSMASLLQSEAPTAKDRVTKFRTASKKALLYQTLAPLHGPSANLSGLCYGCDQYPDLDIRPRDQPEKYEFFCRISRRRGRRQERLILQGFLKWNEMSRLLELPEEVDMRQEWGEQLEPLLQALTHSSHNHIQPYRIDGISDLKQAVMSNLSVTLVAVPRTSIYQPPTLVIGAHMFTGNRMQITREAYQIFFNEAYLDSHARNLAEDGGSRELCLSIEMSEDGPARLRGFGFL